jgi:His-Xaa-Ser system protein HxsD
MAIRSAGSKQVPMKDEDIEGKTIAVSFDSHVFSLIAVKKAAYKYIDSFSADISLKNDEVRCLLKLTPPGSDEGCARLVDDFKKEVLDQDLRETLKVETEPVRNLILAHAFSKTGIISHEPVSDD